jgi:hypothetical protein
MAKNDPVILQVHRYGETTLRVHIPKKLGFEDDDYVILRRIDNDQLMSMLGATDAIE